MTLILLYELRCFTCDARLDNELLDGAIFTPTLIRQEARLQGWRRARSQRTGDMQDYCPNCNFNA